MGTKKIQRRSCVASSSLCCSIWNLSACFARNDHPSNKIDLGDPRISARVGLVYTDSVADPLLRSSSQIEVRKDAESYPMAFAPHVDLDPACGVTRRR